MSPTNALFFNLFMWSKVILLKLPVEENKDVDLCHDGFNGHTLAPFEARLPGAERVTISTHFGERHEETTTLCGHCGNDPH